MTELKTLVGLQAQVFAFLAQQDEATLQALAAGEAQLAILGASGASVAAPPAPAGKPRSDSERLAEGLATLTTEQDRRSLLAAAKPTKRTLGEVAKELKIKRYSHLTVAKLVDLLARHGAVEAEAPAGDHEPGPAHLEPEQPAEPEKSPAEVAAVVVQLREAESEEEGAEYLRAQQLDRASLLAVAAELQLTRVDRLSRADLEKKVLKQAISARRKFAGLRSW
ncbi:hypothetical protein VSH64_02445 [Amycolatopsis rhabdoformis]|uniref:Rho termination factor N-terminal domain-containing protein n=1 Tax=Amycolatopsis rhabdoformis TaxID=1448059 RepID=A0ABZ1I955_9PSEU|nr:hypothetical protein [Amycolatopsis rhabdoformis]WSE30991.1 hypothetical protein VSH64_02445 [Amycolatopsis rhabdoformis]